MSLPAEIDALRQALLAGLKALGWQDGQSTGKATATRNAEGTAAPASAATTADKPETNTAHLAPAHPALRLPAQAPEQLLAYLALLYKWNKAYNLTAVRDPAEMLTLHLLDCLASIAPIEQHLGQAPHELIDVGSGGGLPGIVYAIAWPKGQQHLVDTVGKKAAFLQQCKLHLKLANLHVHHQRIEQLQWPAKAGLPATENAAQAGATSPACNSALNSSGNAAADRAPTNADSPRASTTTAPRIFTCRAFASLHDFVTQTWHLREAGSQWIALKGQWPEQEISELETKTAQLLKSTFTLQSIELHPPGLGDAKRHLICLQSNGTAL